ncbi:MAG: Mth938-like domain-containing protein [Rhodospirillales bacterium]|nr:Mth938-like domain-containing protein [Alphaproteobacteria bacterium]MCB9986194.1 Mth938-like domain-containing protein [Rhodospirillales bacterium]USO07249.1 MAG: Mth938-like domain-containing protein [Rhodospirillales bacterium]
MSSDITPLIRANQMVIQSYGTHGFKISGTVYGHPVIVLPDRVLAWDGVSMDALAAIKDEVDLVLMGTGARVRILPPAQRPAGMRLDFMDTGAAARAYNALLADGRRVAAALKSI